MSAGASTAESRPEVFARLLPQTVEHAATQVPYYRERWGDRWRSVRAPEDLSRLPFLEKSEATVHQAELLSGTPSAFVGVVSSGTLHGTSAPLRILRSADESEALRSFLRQAPPSVSAPASASGATPSVERPLLLEVKTLHHGLPLASTTPGRLRMPWTYTASALRLFRELVTQPQADGGRVVSLHLGAGALTACTMHLLEEGVAPAEQAVRLIGTYGFRLSPFWRERLEGLWGAELYDNYSLSEFDAAAFECRACGFNHWTTPVVLPEVVDLHSRQPLESGTGVLVLTGLYPFVQAMPLIRYWTGDLVELGPVCDVTGEKGIRCRGRVTQALRAPPGFGAPALVYPQDVSDFLDGRPESARHPHPMEVLGLVQSVDTGVPRFELTGSAEAAPTLKVELRFDPRVFAEAAHALGVQLGRWLLDHSPALAAWEATGAGPLKLELVGPGTLTQRWSKF